jgi:Fe-S-cluster containining protein
MDNTKKILWYLRLVAKEPIQIDGREEWMGIRRIKLASTVFNTDGCEVCGDCCCVHEDNVYTQHEYDKIMNMTEEQFRAEGYIFSPEGFDPSYLVRLKEKLYTETHQINGKEVPFYIAKVEDVKLTRTHCAPEKQSIEVPRCTWTHRDTDGLTKCAIHPVRSITCDMPHVRFIYRKGVTLSIGIVQYGRNWAMGCPVKFHEPKDETEWQHNKDNVLRKLKHLNRNAEDLGIDTYLPEVIEYMEAIPYKDYQSYLGRDIVNLDGASTSASNKHSSQKQLFSV